MFLSDNGGCDEEYGHDNPSYEPGPEENCTYVGPGWAYAQNTPFRRYKAWMHEGGTSTAFIVRWPGGVQPGAITDQVVHNIDNVPTLAEAGVAAYPVLFGGRKILPVEGISLLPVLCGRQRVGHEQLWWEFFGNRAVREGEWKLCWDKNARKWELYDLVNDRTETKDLADRFPLRVDRMSQSWLAWAERTGVTLQ